MLLWRMRPHPGKPRNDRSNDCYDSGNNRGNCCDPCGLLCATGRSLTDLQRAALQMLAKSPRGYALSTAVVRGFSFEMLQGLVRVGYATAHRDAVGIKKEKLPHLRITEAGRSAIAGSLR